MEICRRVHFEDFHSKPPCILAAPPCMESKAIKGIAGRFTVKRHTNRKGMRFGAQLSCRISRKAYSDCADFRRQDSGLSQ